VLQGEYPRGETLHAEDEAGAEITAYIVGPEGTVRPAHYMQGMLHYDAPLKGHHWLIFVSRRLEGDALAVSMAKYRFYNANGDVDDSVLKEIRGRTIDSKFGRPPLDELPFEIVIQEPEKEHHISCCLFSGDVARVKAYSEQQAMPNTVLQITTNDGWQTRLQTGNDGVAAFELPLTAHVNSEREKFAKRHILISAEYTVERAGRINDRPYKRIHYTMTEPVMFHPSALEWAAKAPAFALVVAVTLLLGLGVFFYRMRVRKRRYLAK
jgi:hypothetical protein